jgi:hypothetical protein
MKDMFGHLGPIGPEHLSVDVMGQLHGAAQRVWLSPQDAEMMQRHLQHCEMHLSGIVALVGEVLRQKLAHGRRLGPEAVAAPVATGGATLGYRLGGDQPGILARLCYRVRLRDEPGVVPLRSLLGATLIGMRLGETAPLLLSDGSLTEVTLTDLRAPARGLAAGRLPVAVPGQGGILPA